ncbi:hypothetical protein [Sulfitobacter sp. JB4-11]|uniref:hypothetical protein n=1 Tax=Sulfitobacter rhodophyticola TaxID=3238304 RepID=UPI0035196C96
MTFRPTLWLCAALSLAQLSCTPAAIRAPVPAPPETPTGKAEILLLGDSQISFGAGGAYLQFLQTLGRSCPGVPARFATAKAQAIGVRSTALHHWTASSAPDRDPICEIDKTYGVNAGSYGVTSPGLTYVQIGAADYPFCSSRSTPLESAVTHIDPDLIILAFLGNATDRWQSARTARADWQAADAQLPQDIPCMVMTTIPAFEPAENRRRQSAQENLRAAVLATDRCGFVPGLTPATLKAIEARKDNFRTDATGRVTDATHPTAASAARYIQINQPLLCAGLRAALAD